MKKKVSILALLCMFVAGFMGCSPDFDEPPAKEYKYEGKATHTIAQFKNAYSSNFAQITDNVVLRGVINATDESGNIYKKMYLQDETGGIEISIDATSLYTTFKVGQEVFIECKGLYVGKSYGLTVLGYPFKKDGAYEVGRIPQIIGLSHIFKNGKADKPILPIVVNSISELKPEMTDQVVTIKKIFFINGGTQPFAYKGTSSPSTSQSFVDANGRTGVVYTSSYARFATDLLPKGQGSITGIISSYNGQWQLIVRDRNDIGTFDPSVVDPPKPPAYTGNATHTIAQFKALYNADLAEITDNIVLKGIVTSSDQSGNIFKKIYIQDETGAIELNIGVKELYKRYQPGQEVFVECKGLYMGKYGGVHQIGVKYLNTKYNTWQIGQMSENDAYDHIFTKQGPGPLVTPISTTIAGLTPDMVDQLVTISGLQFTNAGKNTYAGSSNTSEELKDNAGNSIILYTSSYASFAGTKLPEGSVTITAIASMYNGKWQLIIRDLNDVVK